MAHLRVRIPRAQPELLDRLRARLPESVELLAEEGSLCDVLVTGVPSRAELEAGPRAVVIPYAGVPARTRELLKDYPAITLHNLHHNAAPTAETAVALLLAAAKRIVPLDRAMRAGDWRPRYEGRDELLLLGKLALVLGRGAVGGRVAEACRGLGMRVEAFGRGGDWKARLPEAHALIVTVPLTPETEGMLGAAELARLPHGAVVVNVGRGAVIEERALYEALAEGRLRAGLDVWYRYPEGEEQRDRTAPGECPFHELANVVMSPHRAGSCDGIEELRAEHLARLLEACLRGEEMGNRVDLERGY